MPTTIDITIPYNGGSIGSVSESNLGQGNGNHFTWIGGNNGRKFVSVRLQNNPNFMIVNVFEVDDLRSASQQITTLYSEAIPENPASNAYSRHLRLCRINSNTVFVKSYGPVAGGASELYVIEVDETDNSVTLHNVTNTETTSPAGYSNFYNGGVYDYTGEAAHYSGRGVHQLFMQQINENKIVSYESLRHPWAQYNFVQRTWDPVAKTMSLQMITPSEHNSNLLGLQDPTPFGNGTVNTTYQVVYDPNSSSPSALNISHPTLHGKPQGSIPSGYENNGYCSWLNCVEGRDGKLHFSLGRETTNSSWQARFTTLSEQRYVITYDPSDDSWTTTSRFDSNYDLSNARNHMGIWLPLNTVKSKDHHPAGSNYDDKQCHAKSWIAIGAKSAKVVGYEGGSECVISNSNNSYDDAFQAMWLDEDHFIVFWAIATDGNLVRKSNNVKYTVVRYYDEHFMESVSEGIINADSYLSYMGQSMFRKVDDYTLISDAFSRVVTFWAPEA